MTNQFTNSPYDPLAVQVEGFLFAKITAHVILDAILSRSVANVDKNFSQRGNVRSSFVLGVRDTAVDRRRKFGSRRGRAVHNRELSADENIPDFRR